jgi:hypothetical protein
MALLPAIRLQQAEAEAWRGRKGQEGRLHLTVESGSIIASGASAREMWRVMESSTRMGSACVCSICASCGIGNREWVWHLDATLKNIFCNYNNILRFEVLIRDSLITRQLFVGFRFDFVPLFSGRPTAGTFYSCTSRSLFGGGQEVGWPLLHLFYG